MNIRHNGIFRELKWAWQRAKDGYDERIKWGFDGYLEQFIKPLKEFCEYELKNTHPDNIKRIAVYERTLELIKDYEEMAPEEEYQEENPINRLWEYFGKHIGYYWD